MNMQIDTDLAFAEGGVMVDLLQKELFSCIWKRITYFALLSVIFNLQSCTIAPIEPESDNLKGVCWSTQNIVT